MKERKNKQQKANTPTPEPVVNPTVELHKCTNCKISKPEPEFVQTHITKQCRICREEKNSYRIKKENVRTVKNVNEFLAKKYIKRVFER